MERIGYKVDGLCKFLRAVDNYASRLRSVCG